MLKRFAGSSNKELGFINRFVKYVSLQPSPKLMAIKAKDLEQLEKFTAQMSSLNTLTATASHPVTQFAQEAKRIVDSGYNKKLSTRQIFRSIDEHLSIRSIASKKVLANLVHVDDITSSVVATAPPAIDVPVPAIEQTETVTPSSTTISSSTTTNNKETTSMPSSEKLDIEAHIRLLYARNYLARILKAIEEKDIDENDPNINFNIVIKKLIDAAFVGTGSERIIEHLTLYGESFTNERLQDSMYAYCEPETETCVTLFEVMLQNKHKDHKKRLPKFGMNYLLDVLELNGKVRAVWHWSDPTFTVHKPFPAEHTFTLAEVLKSRKEFFTECEVLSKEFMTAYINERKTHYSNKEENNKNLRMGIYYFIATCLLDWLIFEI